MKIDLHDVGRYFPSVWALRHVSHEFESNHIYAILGANGAGKSTLLTLLAGWLPITEGRILLDGSPMRPTSARLRRKLMLLGGQQSNRDPSLLYPLRVLARDIADYRVDRPGIEDEVARWCERLDVVAVAHRKRSEMSAGQSFKYAMAGLFVIAPSVWLLDEPYSAGLDADGIQILESQIRQHAAGGGIVIFSSQWPEHANRIASRVVVLHNGAIAWSGASGVKPPADITAEAPGALAAVLKGLN